MIGTVGESALIKKNPNFVIKNVGLFKRNEKKISSKFLIKQLHSQNFRRTIKSFLNGGIQKFIGLGDLRKLPFILPPLPEQKRIVEVLETWDSYLEKLEKKIEIKKKIKKGLLQQLLTGKKRLPGFNSKWRETNVGEIFKYIKTYAFSREKLLKRGLLSNGIGNIHYGDIHSSYKATSIDISKVIVPQIKNIDFIPKSNDFLIDGDIVMADASEDFDGVGVAITLHGLKNKRVLGGLHTFVLRDTKSKTAQYYRQYIFCNQKVKFQLKKIATGVSVLGLSKSNLNKINIQLPKKEEQTAIAKILTTADEEIEILEKQKEKIKAQKKYLLNNLITGRIRLPEFRN